MNIPRGWNPVVLLVAGVLLSFCGGWFTHKFTDQTPPPSPIREDSEKYTFINPLLLFAIPEQSTEYADLKKQINNYILSAKKENKASSISVYFSDLNSGAWAGVNQEELYTPASTMKVAIMIGYLKRINNDPSILSKKLYYKASKNSGQYFAPQKLLPSGYYTVGQLLDTMIIESDNNALNALYENDPQSYIDVFQDLDIPLPKMDTEDFMSPRIYSRIFRSLYNATYTSRALSEQALKLLSHTEFVQGLVAGIPEKVVISHKFGEHSQVDPVGTVLFRELHDCGIIYHPQKPYFLCVMTKGTEFEKLSSVISDISKITYEYVRG